MMRILLCWFLVFKVQFITGTVRWTNWFNTDDPTDGDDIETLERIRKVRPEVCKEGEPINVRCRISGSHEEKDWFDHDPYWRDNYLDTPCTKHGLTCLRSDQIKERCHDYEIKFFCQVEDNHNGSVNGGYIAMAAGFSVVIPLVCVLIIQLKKAKRAQNEIHIPSTTSPNPDLPPSYSELFGTTTNLVSNHSSSTQVLLETDSPLHQSPSSSLTDFHQSTPSLVTISGCEPIEVIHVGEAEPVAPPLIPSHSATSCVSGLQLSINELVTDYYNQTPPPTYSEALEILRKTGDKV